MKMIVAVIQPEKLDEVRQALIDTGISRVTVTRVTGHGRQEDIDLYRGQEVVPDLLTKVRLEVALNDAFVEPAIEAICKAAKNNGGKIGDGKIFVLPLEKVVRIRTGETGGDAV
ncbi:Nitrogen regulatory protein P-II [Poriferisphaera corsica]|uniref:Nitrogen regulatory protein P-II n=1 Tax=Poriferisphaera corsica TaxID=2528020 RepID=A0A517YT44_9BACT|nr:P-II family nitrogen regulator [Poriferisphaera corsica]QDU33417.1 Nitrogen regulatory protein P-II [Poriferisphaera corsica]